MSDRYVVIDTARTAQDSASSGLVGWCRTAATARALALSRRSRGHLGVVVVDTLRDQEVFPFRGPRLVRGTFAAGGADCVDQAK